MLDEFDPNEPGISEYERTLREEIQQQDQENHDFMQFVEDKRQAEDDSLAEANREAEFERRSRYDEDDPLAD